MTNNQTGEDENPGAALRPVMATWRCPILREGLMVGRFISVISHFFRRLPPFAACSPGCSLIFPAGCSWERSSMRRGPTAARNPKPSRGSTASSPPCCSSTRLGLALRAQWPPVARWLAAPMLGLLTPRLGHGPQRALPLRSVFQSGGRSAGRFSTAARVGGARAVGRDDDPGDDLPGQRDLRRRSRAPAPLADAALVDPGPGRRLHRAARPRAKTHERSDDLLGARETKARHSFFATYYYHANGGAFLNLILPPVACLALRAISREDDPAGRVLWPAALLIVVAGEAVNTSRGAQVVALLLGVAILAWPARPCWPKPGRSSGGPRLAALCFVP